MATVTKGCGLSPPPAEVLTPAKSLNSRASAPCSCSALSSPFLVGAQVPPTAFNGCPEQTQGWRRQMAVDLVVRPLARGSGPA